MSAPHLHVGHTEAGHDVMEVRLGQRRALTEAGAEDVSENPGLAQGVRHAEVEAGRGRTLGINDLIYLIIN